MVQCVVQGPHAALSNIRYPPTTFRCQLPVFCMSQCTFLLALDCLWRVMAKQTHTYPYPSAPHPKKEDKITRKTKSPQTLSGWLDFIILLFKMLQGRTKGCSYLCVMALAAWEEVLRGCFNEQIESFIGLYCTISNYLSISILCRKTNFSWCHSINTNGDGSCSNSTQGIYFILPHQC